MCWWGVGGFGGTSVDGGQHSCDRRAVLGAGVQLEAGVQLVAGVQLTLVENMVKKNRSRFPIAVLLTTLICSH